MTTEPQIEAAPRPKQPATVKCVVWDLDNTVWDGVLLEDSAVALRPAVVEILKTLDARGILHSIASKNDHTAAIAKLTELGIAGYFLYPQINWNTKSSSLRVIATSINIGLDTLAFVDDQPFELEEVAFAFPEVLCLDSADLAGMLDIPALNPRFITEDSKLRRQMYMSDIERNQAEKEFVGPNETFLATLQMKFAITPAEEEDLKRAEELTVRTNQLNTTGYTYSYEDLDALRTSPSHRLLIASLQDTYGPYGKIGLLLIACAPEIWTVKLLLMSCRVMSRGVGAIMLNHCMRLAQAAGVRLQAEFVPNDRNRMMYITYKFGGFREVDRRDGVLILEHDLSTIQPFPAYVQVTLG